MALLIELITSQPTHILALSRIEIVPTGSDLIVEAKVDPKDIADIVIGQDVKISLTAYDPSKFGRIDGNVSGISADAINDKQTGEQYYMVDVSMSGTLYEDNGDSGNSAWNGSVYRRTFG